MVTLIQYEITLNGGRVSRSLSGLTDRSEGKVN